MSERRAAERRGRSAEFLCAWALRCKGYRVLDRRARGPLGEIGIVARRRAVLAIVEGGGRLHNVEPLETVKRAAWSALLTFRGDATHSPRLIVLDGLDNLLVSVHYEGAVPGDLLPDWASSQQEYFQRR